ncbi:MAG TPA: GatB/YqeY domain-containing protein [Jiangellaceae bacterium]
MDTLKERLQSDLTTAMRERDLTRTATLRMALTAISTAEVAGKQARQLSDDEIVAVLTKEAKKRREAADAYRDGGRAESAAAEEAEAEIIAEYLPEPLTEEELSSLVDEAIAEAGAESPRDMGKVMKLLTPRVAGRADGKTVAAAVKNRLA